jgi:rod shape-determining protein MreB
LIEEPMAAAIGAGLPVKEPKGSLVVDIGGGTTEIGVVSLGGLVISKSIKVAGDKIDISIVNYVRKKHSLLIGERTGEEIKIAAGSAVPLDEEIRIVVKGKNHINGLLSRIELTDTDVREAMSEPLKEIVAALKDVLERMPPDLASDIVENGIVLTGGGALIRGLDKYIADIVKLPVFVANEPLLAVAKGTGHALEELELLQQLNDE